MKKIYKGLDGKYWYEEKGEWKSTTERATGLPYGSDCNRCEKRFKCFTTNTSRRPTQVSAINFEIANCCYRCKHSHFTCSSYNNQVPYNYYKEVGDCKLHQVLVHQFSSCDKFTEKDHDNLSTHVREKMLKEMKAKISRHHPRFCLIKEKK